MRFLNGSKRELMENYIVWVERTDFQERDKPEAFDFMDLLFTMFNKFQIMNLELIHDSDSSIDSRRPQRTAFKCGSLTKNISSIAENLHHN